MRSKTSGASRAMRAARYEELLPLSKGYAVTFTHCFFLCRSSMFLKRYRLFSDSLGVSGFLNNRIEVLGGRRLCLAISEVERIEYPHVKTLKQEQRPPLHERRGL